MEPVHLPIKTKNVDKIVETTASAIIDSKENLMNLETLRKIISLSSSRTVQIDESETDKWQIVLAELLRLISANEETGNETVQLAAHAYLALRRALYSSSNFEQVLRDYLDLRSNQIIDFKRIFLVHDVELFRLIMCHGLLQTTSLRLPNNIDVSGSTEELPLLQLYRTVLKIVKPHCIGYTRHTYFAFKIIQAWMQKTPATGLWAGDTVELERSLESIIFCNWDNAICKTSVVGLFAAYLEVMKDKHEDFLPYLFHSCVERISWCHVTKYTILAEICAAMDGGAYMITEAKFVSNLFNSLTVVHLCNASTKVYSVIWRKLSMNAWKTVFGAQLKDYVATWEAEKKYNALQVLCKCWLEPTIKTHRDMMPFLLECCGDRSVLFRSHMLRIAKKYGLSFSYGNHDVTSLLNHEDEFVRLNAFAAHCYAMGSAASQTEDDNDDVSRYDSAISAVKHFLFNNATASTTYLREGSFNHFKIFLAYLLRRAYLRKDSSTAMSFLEWLNELRLDCFEIGSCYQRKIFGLQLYKIALQFLQGNDCVDLILLKDPHFKEALKYGPILRKEMEDSQRWRFTDRQSVLLLFKLVLDPASDVRHCAASIIVKFFDENVITESEKMTLFATALNKCNSHKFFETESGAYIFKILTKWYPLSKINAKSLIFDDNSKPRSSIKEFQTYARFLYEEAVQQLILAKKDILKAATQNTPFYGIVTALLMIGLNNGPESHLMSSKFLEEIINMAENAVKFFLTTFSIKSSNFEHSSSFEEMGLAIDEAIKNSEIDYEFDELVLSPAQQSIITCVWRSLKILCELAVAVAKNEHSTDTAIRRAGDLIVTVSIKCRHKGAIESAGVAIADLTRHLCKRQRNVELLENHLKRLLSDDFSTSINLTRRGAGLTILFHKIVASDARPERPLLHLAVNTLLRSLDRKLSASKAHEFKDSSNFEEPCAMQLHFLKSIVADKQLHPQLSPYLEQICLICFEYIPSPVFTIRNASYQLFGAITTRLVGQNTGARSIDFGYGYSINYFATHFPQLAGHVLLSLQQACCHLVPGSRSISTSFRTSSSSVIHVLALISKMFYAGCVLVDGNARTYVDRIRNCLVFFLGSPVACVRGLAARTLAATSGLSEIEAKLAGSSVHRADSSDNGNDINRLNGRLIALEYLHEKRDEELRSTSVRHTGSKSPSEVRRNLELRIENEALWALWASRCGLVERKRICYAIEAQLLRLSREFRIIVKEEQLLANDKLDGVFESLMIEERTRPGFFDFVDELVRLFVSRISSNGELTLVRSILEANFDLGISFVRQAPHSRGLLMTCVDFAIENFDAHHQLLLEEINVYANEAIQNIERSGLEELQHIDVLKLKCLASKLEAVKPAGTAQLSELKAFLRALLIRDKTNCDVFKDLLVSGVTNNDQTEAARLLMAKALEILLCNFRRLKPECRTAPLLASLTLLKDEVDSVRDPVRDSLLDHVILEFQLSSTRIMDELVFYVLLLDIASEKSRLLGEISHSELIAFFRRYLATVSIDSGTTDIENPFDDDNITPCNEDSKILNFLVFCMQRKVSKCISLDDKDVSVTLFDTKNQLVKRMNIDLDDLRSILNVKYDEYLAHKLHVVNEVYISQRDQLQV